MFFVKRLFVALRKASLAGDYLVKLVRYYKDNRQDKEKTKKYHRQQQQQAGYELNIKMADVIHERGQNVSVYIDITIS